MPTPHCGTFSKSFYYRCSLIESMGDDLHKPGLYRWKRQENPRVYSRAQNVTTNHDIQNWIQKVEDASNRAAEQVFGVNHTSGRSRGKAIAKATREYIKDDEQAYSEAQDLLSQWMEEKVNLTGGLDPEIDCNYDDDAWEKHELQSDVKREWDNMLANNYEEYGLQLSSRDTPDKYSTDLYNVDEEDAVATVMKNMLDKQVVKKEFKKDLGLDKWGKQKDPRSKMHLRHQQVKENRQKRDAELRQKHEEQQNRKIVQSAAKQLVLKEERMKEQQARREEMEIRKEMTKIRKQMQTDRRNNDERKAKERHDKEEVELAARVKVAWDTEREGQENIEAQRKYEDKQRLLAQRVRELETREAATNLRVLHRHFSGWYNLVLDRRLKMGKARALYDWKLILRAWNAWRAYVRTGRMDRETKHFQQEVVNTQRNQQRAERHSRLTLLRKYFVAWQVYVHSEQERRQLEQAQNSTRSKMASLLEAAATGKLCGQVDTESVVTTGRGQTPAGTHRVDKPSTADKINAMFENTRKLPAPSDSLSTTRSDVTTPDTSHHKVPRSRIPTEPWQVTRRHLDLTPEEMANLPGAELDCSPEEMNAKILKKYGRQPWHKREVSTYEHRHAAQKKILEEQKRQIMEQQRLIEDLQFKSTHVELQKQLTEQKLVLEQMKRQVEITDRQTRGDGEGENNNNNTPQPSGKPGIKAKPQLPKKSSNQRPQSAGALTNHKTGSLNHQKTVKLMSHKSGEDTSRTEATTARTAPVSARTEMSQMSRPSSYTSTVSEKSKYLQVLKNMDDRASERTRAKKEREEKRKKVEEERLAQLEAEAEVTRQQDELEKKARVEAYRDRKRLEKQRDLERQMTEEKLRQQTALAEQHFDRSLLKYRGLVPLRKLVQMAKTQEERAIQHYRQALQRKVLLSWYTTVKEEWREKEALADEMSNFLCLKHAFQNWRLYKHHMIIEEHKARRHYERNMKTRLFQAWRDYANEEKVASWEKERRARDHYKTLLLRRHFRAWRRMPDEILKEKERERRRAELREKVASLLPDFEPTRSVNESSDFHI